LAARGEQFEDLRDSFGAAVSGLAECVDWIVANYANDARAVHAVSVPFLMLTGIVAGGWQMARAALAAERRLAGGGGDAGFFEAKIGTARFYADHVLPRAHGLRDTVMHGAASVTALKEDQL